MMLRLLIATWLCLRASQVLRGWDWVDLGGEREQERQFRPSTGPRRARRMRGGYLAGWRRGRIMGVTDKSGLQ